VGGSRAVPHLHAIDVHRNSAKLIPTPVQPRRPAPRPTNRAACLATVAGFFRRDPISQAVQLPRQSAAPKADPAASPCGFHIISTTHFILHAIYTPDLRRNLAIVLPRPRICAPTPSNAAVRAPAGPGQGLWRVPQIPHHAPRPARRRLRRGAARRPRPADAGPGPGRRPRRAAPGGLARWVERRSAVPAQQLRLYMRKITQPPRPQSSPRTPTGTAPPRRWAPAPWATPVTPVASVSSPRTPWARTRACPTTPPS
jgi:hypothetical protein